MPGILPKFPAYTIYVMGIHTLLQRKRGINMFNITKVLSARDHSGVVENNDEIGSRENIEVALSNDRTITTNCHPPLFGVIVNTHFLPAQWLDRAGNVKLE